jgi:hypothetical protein
LVEEDLSRKRKKHGGKKGLAAMGWRCKKTREVAGGI